MGLYTLEELTSELSLNLGGRSPGPDRLNLWVNLAIQNLASHIYFEELKTKKPFNVFEGITKYPAPTDLLGIRYIELNGVKLKKMERQWSEEDVTATAPTYFERRGTDIIIWPEPDDYYEGYIEYIKTPAKLTTSTDKSPFPSFWDLGIIMLATHQGHLALGEQDEADRWLIRFSGYKNSRVADKEVSRDVPRGGVNVAWEWADIGSENPPHLEE